MKTNELNMLLRTRYAAPEYAILFEVANATGARHQGWCDAVVMGLYPSRGLNLTGCECKISRSDWLRELKKPEKAEPVFKFMDHWLLVTGPDVAKREEIPSTWGWLEVRGEKLVQVVAPPKLTPKPVDRTFLAALLRRASEAEHAVVVKPGEKALTDKFNEGHNAGYATAEAFWKKNADEIREAVNAFEADTGFHDAGLRIAMHSAWRNKTLGDAVRRVLANDVIERNLEQLRDQARRIADELDVALKREVPA